MSHSHKRASSVIRVEYSIGIMLQSACLVTNTFKVYNYRFIFKCMAVGQTSLNDDSDLKLPFVDQCLMFAWLGPLGSTRVFL